MQETGSCTFMQTVKGRICEVGLWAEQAPAQVVQLGLQGGQALLLALVHVGQLVGLALAHGRVAVRLLRSPAPRCLHQCQSLYTGTHTTFCRMSSLNSDRDLANHPYSLSPRACTNSLSP